MKEKSVVAERFVRTLKNKIYKHMTAVSKTVYFDVLDDIVDKYNNATIELLKLNLLMLNLTLMSNTMLILTKKIPNVKFVIILVFQSTKIFLLNDMLLIVWKKFL